MFFLAPNVGLSQPQLGRRSMADGGVLLPAPVRESISYGRYFDSTGSLPRSL